MTNRSSTFCILPWVHTYMNPDGAIYPCCRLGGKKPLGNINDGLEEVWNSEKFKNLREKLLTGEKSEYCEQCYVEDEAGLRSMRQKVNKRFSHHIPKATSSSPTMKLAWMDFRFSNLCNYKCTVCGPHLSSSWNGGEVVSPEIDVISEVEQYLDGLEAVYFGGGEPLLMEEHYRLLEKLISLNKSDVHLSYNTNLSILNYKENDILSLWASFSNVELWVSLDGSQELGERIRQGMNWKVSVENFLKVKKACPHIKMVVACTVSTLNAKHLTEFHHECLTLGLLDQGEHFTINILHNPQKYGLKSLDKPEKEFLVKHYQDYIDNHLVGRSEDIGHFKSVIKFLSN